MKKILLLLSNGFEMLEASPFTDIFGWNSIVGSKNIQIVTGGIHPELTCTFNFKVIPEINLSVNKINVKDFSALVIPGGFGFKNFFTDIKSDIFKEIIQEFNNQNKPILGICTGVFALGEAGILENIPATTYLLDNERYFKQLQNFKAISLKKDIIIHKNIITSSGPKTAFDLAWILLETLSTKETVRKVKKEMGF
ncbi:DJ-1/PfpI family protein [Cetobacterium sp. SF1]|uniref:DJ-1/PfpI family protein n=1 Tax=Cetobacterium sp. SF1 TaxID=3417654 RepID=UPI003CEC47AE